MTAQESQLSEVQSAAAKAAKEADKAAKQREKAHQKEVRLLSTSPAWTTACLWLRRMSGQWLVHEDTQAVL